jgi:hypothetical protein
MGNNATVMCAEEKLSKIKKITPVKEPAGWSEGGPPGGLS